MELVELKRLLNNRIDIAVSDNSEIEVYFFGSILDEKNDFTDIDILIIYDDPSNPPLIRNAFSEIELPIHPIFLTKNEEKEFNFINETNAKKISI